MSSWPTLPAFSANNFFDHFDSTLNARWTSVTSGTGSVSLTDSYAELLAPVNSAAFLYRNAQLDKTKSQLWTICLSTERTSGSGGLDTLVTLVNGASAPAADTAANITAKTLLATGFGGGAPPTQLHPWYYSSAAAQTFYNNSATDVWGSYPGNANVAVPYARYDDYYVVGIEIDGVNSRWRTFYWAQSYSSTGTWEFNQGWRMFSVSAWVTWANTRSSSNVWLAIGQLANNASGAWKTRVEWARYAEAPAGNTVVDAWVASKTVVAADAHRFKHVYSYDGLTFVPQDRGTWALDLGAGSPDNSEMNEPRALYDGAATDYLFYTGTTGGTTKSICVASAAHVAARTGQNATFTRYGSNPILSLGAAGDFDDKQVGFPDVVKDEFESNSNKRYKMLYAGQKNSDSKRRIGYATSPAATGPWTKQGIVIDVGAGGANDEQEATSPVIVNINGTWEVWYEGHDASSNCHLMRAAGTDLSSLTKDATYYTPPYSATEQALTANLTTAPGRTVTVADTTGYTVDASVILSQSTDLDTYSTSKIRKIPSGTQIELYHGLTGFTTAYPAHIKQTDSSPNLSPRSIVRVGSEWWFLITIWGFNIASASYKSLLEENYLFTHSGANPNSATPVIAHTANPITSRGYTANQRSFENITLLGVPYSPGRKFILIPS